MRPLSKQLYLPDRRQIKHTKDVSIITSEKSTRRPRPSAYLSVGPSRSS